jgi:hypothetical protein
MAPGITESNVLSILRASRMTGHRITPDTIHRDAFRKQCVELRRAGLATIKNETVFITAKGFGKAWRRAREQSASSRHAEQRRSQDGALAPAFGETTDHKTEKSNGLE